MNFLTNILSGGIGNIFTSVGDVIDRFVETPDEKQKALRELREIEERESAKLLEATSSAITAEAQSQDPWVRRARPTFLYIMYLVIVFNFILIPILHMGVQFWGNIPFTPLPIPDELYWLFGSGYLGYAGARTWDKLIQRSTSAGNAPPR